MRLLSLISKNLFGTIFLIVILLLAIGAGVLVYARNMQGHVDTNQKPHAQALNSSTSATTLTAATSALAISATAAPAVEEPKESVPAEKPVKKVKVKPSPVKEEKNDTDNAPNDEPTIARTISKPLNDSEDNTITEIRISKAQNMLRAYHNDRLVRSYPVATGVNNCTPVGTFEIISKAKNPGQADLGTRWLAINKHSERTGRQYGIHGTNEPNTIGYQKSHGCVRLFNEDVEELYKITPEGATVIIMNGDF